MGGQGSLAVARKNRLLLVAVVLGNCTVVLPKFVAVGCATVDWLRGEMVVH